MDVRHRLTPGVIVVVALAFAIGCDCGEEAIDDEPVEETEEVADEEPEAGDELDEVFGLPVPADHRMIREQKSWVRVSTEMDLEELAAFFRHHVVDAEIVEADNRLEVVPLRPQSPTATASHRTTTNSPLVINYRQSRSPAAGQIQRPPVDEVADGEEDGASADDESDEDRGGDGLAVLDDVDGESVGGGDLPSLGERPDWLNDIKGEPVEITTDDGELMAPGAKWGEPYVPPEGSPLHQERFRHNFGRPFGDWR